MLIPGWQESNRLPTEMEPTVPRLFLHSAFVLFLGLVLSARSLAAGEVDSSALYSVGLSKIDITPNYPVRLNGFGSRRKESEGVTQRIYAKAIAISNLESDNRAGPPVVIVTIDNLGIRLSMVEEVSRRLQKKVGLDRDRLAVTFSHSHTTPKVNGASDTIFSTPISPEHQVAIDRYTKELTDWIEEASLQALKARKPATLSWSIGKVGFAKNRRTKNGPVDHDLPMLVVRDASDESVRGIYVSYACHCVSMTDNKISGDWAGFAQAAIEHDHAGAICMTSIGCGSDSNPDFGAKGRRIEAAVAQGDAIRAEVGRLMKQKQKALGGALRTTLNQIDLPLNDLPSREELAATAKKGGAAGYSAQWHLTKLDRGEELMKAIDYPIQSVSFGDDLAMLFLAGEVCVDYSHRLKREFDRDRLWINAYANDFCSYIPSERLAKEGGYGGGAEVVYFGVPTTLKAGLEKLIVDEVHRQLPKEFSALKDPVRTGGSRALSPTASRDAIQLPDGMAIELVACEPMVVDPVAIDFGPDGRLWVCEMHDYPEGLDGEFRAGGRIRVLEDTNADGQYDKSTLFAEGLPFPTDVKVWRKGVIACAAPEVVYLEDTDGDGVADRREALLTGFATHNYQARVNSLRPGLDGWMYAAVGLFGGEIESVRNGSRLNLSGRDFRFKPDSGALEAAAGNSQQGRVRDDWGRWFGCSNGNLIKHYPLHDHYLRRNPHLAPPPLEQSVLAGTGFSRLYPAREDPQLFKLSGTAGGVTAACGIGIYRDTLLGSEYLGDAFTCEPVNLAVHRSDLLRKANAIGMTAKAPADKVEFLASTDRWFRPVQARTGPDGALWIVDMYRFIIEHPRWIPPETLQELDVRAGSSRGRIYRVFPKGSQPRAWPRLDGLDGNALVGALDSPNGTIRDLAMQLLGWRGDKSVVPALAQLAARPEIRPEARLQALCVLDQFEALDPSLLVSILSSRHPGLRKHAARLCEKRLAVAPELRESFLALAVDPDLEVRLQFASSLGEWKSPEAGRALAGLLAREGDPYILGAALSSALPHLGPVLVELLEAKPEPPVLPKLLSIAADTLALKDLRPLAAKLARAQASQGVLFLEALRGRNFGEIEVRAIYDEFVPLTNRARVVLSEESPDPAKQREAINLLGRVPREAQDDAVVLLSTLRVNLPLSIQLAALKALRRLPVSGELELSVALELLEHRSSAGPALRMNVLDALMSRPAWTRQLLRELKTQPTMVAALDPARRQALLDHPDKEIAKLASSVINEAVGAVSRDREALVASYQNPAQEKGDAAKGEAVFRQACASCHQVGGIGREIGPDLATLSDLSNAALLIGILDPNRAVLDQYQQYVLATKKGQTLAGMISGETASSVLLKQLDGTSVEILRKDITKIESTGRSLMPEGLEGLVTKERMPDLLAFLARPHAPRKSFALNKPATVAPNAKGLVHLPATASEIYGRDLILEEQFRNLGHWHGAEDRAIWTVKLEHDADYEVFMDYSCDNGAAGNRFLLEGGSKTIRGTVSGTGKWSDYAEISIGSLSLPAGESRLTFRSEGPVKRALLDLRGLRLEPVGK